MVSRQRLHNNQKSLDALRSLIPHDVPLIVSVAIKYNQTEFRVSTLDGQHEFLGRYQQVYAWIDGFVAAKTVPTLEQELAKLKAVRHVFNQ